jgi:hypothetical protein
MKAHIDAIRALLDPLGYPSYYVTVPAEPTTYPYVLVWSSSGTVPVEVPVSGSADLTDTIGVTLVAENPDSVLIATARVRGVLNGAHPAVTGRLTWLNLSDSQPVAVDRDVKPPVAYGVDTYRLVSTPA